MISIENKQKIIDLFNDCDIIVYPEQQIISYYTKNTYWLGEYHLKDERFTYSGFHFKKFFDDVLLRPIIEEIIKRKISVII